ncbi:site-specific integrase [Solibacillus sp. FSL K6-1126]|uniref:site-specific integrase n=1 Tax=Solibacillus sp. FSL K6-1126 TaxID=2921463 RepID=UPI0030F7510F
MLVENLREYIDLDALSEEKFSIDLSVKRAKEILEIFREEDEIFSGFFEDDIWTFERHLYKGQRHYLDFSTINNAVRFRNDWDSTSVVIIKCWAAELLREYHTSLVQKRLSLLIKVIKQTDFFSANKVNDFAEYLRNFTPAVKNYSEPMEPKKDRYRIDTVRDMVITTLNFLTFAELDSFDTYHKPLMDIKKGLPSGVFVRELPKGKDVFKFDYCINRYFERGFSSPSRLFFSPLLLWWKITTIIPMRISEFCTIKRECISQNNGSYYITLPREKKPASQRRVQVVDTLEITKEIYDMIDKYIRLTNPYGNSKTLVSYKTLIAVDKRVTNRTYQKIDYEYFNRNNFDSLLKRFYKDIVYGEYKKSVEREIRPNDTRHFAFCALLMQGISPIEIARLGGHSTIEAQYHYSNHTEYFIDIEVDKLIKSFKRKDKELKGTTFEGNEVSYKDIEKRSYQFPSNNTRLPMKIGFCTDELQRCESEECMLCKHWWIHPEKLVEVKPLIEAKIRERKQKIVEIGNFLKNLNESFTTEMLKQNEVHPNAFTKMGTEAISIQEHLEEIARLEMLKGVDVDE